VSYRLQLFVESPRKRIYHLAHFQTFDLGSVTTFGFAILRGAQNRRTKNNYIYVLILQGDKNESVIVRHTCDYGQGGGQTIRGV
jgi:hypothetical protein